MPNFFDDDLLARAAAQAAQDAEDTVAEGQPPGRGYPPRMAGPPPSNRATIQGAGSTADAATAFIGNGLQLGGLSRQNSGTSDISTPMRAFDDAAASGLIRIPAFNRTQSTELREEALRRMANDDSDMDASSMLRRAPSDMPTSMLPSPRESGWSDVFNTPSVAGGNPITAGFGEALRQLGDAESASGSTSGAIVGIGPGLLSRGGSQDSFGESQLQEQGGEIQEEVGGYEDSDADNDFDDGGGSNFSVVTEDGDASDTLIDVPQKRTRILDPATRAHRRRTQKPQTVTARFVHPTNGPRGAISKFRKKQEHVLQREVSLQETKEMLDRPPSIEFSDSDADNSSVTSQERRHNWQRQRGKTGQFLGDGDVEVRVKVVPSKMHASDARGKLIIVTRSTRNDVLNVSDSESTAMSLRSVPEPPDPSPMPSRTSSSASVSVAVTRAGGQGMGKSSIALRHLEERRVKEEPMDETLEKINSKGKKCAYVLCPNADKSSGTWKTVTKDTNAGHRDWSPYIGLTFCHACWTQYRTKGTLERLGRRGKAATPPPPTSEVVRTS